MWPHGRNRDTCHKMRLCCLRLRRMRVRPTVTIVSQAFISFSVELGELPKFIAP